MVFQNNLLMAAAAATASSTYTVDYSCLFNDDDDAVLYKTFGSSPASDKKFTFSTWIKLGNIEEGNIFTAVKDGSNFTFLQLTSTGQLRLSKQASGSIVFDLKTTQLLRDSTGWYHILVAYDSTPSTPGPNDCYFYINGVKVTSFATETYPSQNVTHDYTDTTYRTDVSGFNVAGGLKFDGYQSQTAYFDNQKLTATDVSEFDDNGVWRPIDITGLTYASNSFLLDYADSSAFGNDVSGNDNDFTSSGLTSSDQVTDTPTNNFATFINVGSGVTLSEGNLKITTTSTGWKVFPASLRIPDTGKWVYKVSVIGDASTSPGYAGEAGTSTGGAEYPMIKPWGKNAVAIGAMSGNFTTLYMGHGEIAAENNETNDPQDGLPTLSTSDTCEVYLDNDNNTVKYYKNGTQVGDTITGMNTLNYAFHMIYYSGSSITWDFGQHGFTRTDDTYNYISTANFPTPDVTNGTENFQTTLYMGTGASQTIGQDSNSYFNTYGSGDRTSIITSGASGGSYNPAAGTNMVDGNKTGGPGITGYATDQYFYFNMDEAVNITEVTIPMQSSGYNLGNSWVWEGSNNDFTDTTTLSSAIDMSNTDLVEVHTLNLIGASDTYSYYRIRNSNGSGANSTQWMDFEFKVGVTSSSQSRSTFQPDMVWIKNRSAADEHKWIDAARGVEKELSSDSIAIESTDSNGLTAFASSGFTLGTGAGGYNDVGENFVAWQWLAGGGAGSSNTDGSLNTTTTTVNASAGISISTYTGGGSATTIGHGLGAKPKFIIQKERGNDVGSWHVYHAGIASDAQTDYMTLDAHSAKADLAGIWNDTAPTSTVLSLGSNDDVTGSGDTFVCYAFAEVEGFSRFSSYVGNGAALGTPVFCGFKPAWVMIKRTDSTGDWVMYDTQRSPFNEADDQLLANTTAAETTGSEEIDFLATGFRPRTSDAAINASDGKYVYAAFAEYPFGGGSDVTPATAF
jgi:hypothetical protein